MVKFGVSTGKASGLYDVRAGALWRVRINAGQRGQVVLKGGRRLDVSSNNAQVVPNDDSVFVRTDQPGGN